MSQPMADELHARLKALVAEGLRTEPAYQRFASLGVRTSMLVEVREAIAEASA